MTPQDIREVARADKIITRLNTERAAKYQRRDPMQIMQGVCVFTIATCTLSMAFVHILRAVL